MNRRSVAAYQEDFPKRLGLVRFDFWLEELTAPILLNSLSGLFVGLNTPLN
jgi:hypothetical protein